MVPTLRVDDRVVVNKLAYRFGEVERGDVVVFRRPPDEIDPSIDNLIKRVIGLPGETLEARNGLVYVNGRPLAEEYLPPQTISDTLPPTVVPEGHLFVMGDFRNNSRDSRYFGPISHDLLVGQGLARVWPLNHLGVL